MQLNYKFSLSAIFIILMTVILSLSVFAATPSTGYTVDTSGKNTNIKYTMTEDGTLTFEIDPAATDKVQSTVITNRDPITGHYAGWNSPHPTYQEAVKIVIGDGITSVAGFSAMPALQVVEVPTSLTTIVNAAFECSYSLHTFYVRGTEAVKGTFDFTYITKFEGYCFDGMGNMKKIILNPNFSGALPIEFIKRASITEMELPEGVTTLVNNSLDCLPKLKTLTVLGRETTFMSADVFTETDVFPAIRAYSGSKAEEFAKANGFTFIDIESGEVTEGTRPAPIEEPPEEDIGPSSAPVTVFNPEGATIYGHSSGKYNGMDIVNTYWAYYADTKTLEFVSATSNYNETGSLGNCDADGENWSEYKNEIEHIIVGDNISKVTGGAFSGYPALKDIRLGREVAQFDAGAVSECPNLTTIWRDGTERTEGRADLSKLLDLVDVFTGSAIKEIIIPSSVKTLNYSMPMSVETIYSANITDELKAYCEVNFCNLVNLNNQNERYENYVYIDTSLPSCGKRATFYFDEATGTLTISGVGIVDDVVNYYGGGSKNSPWFSVKQKIKHVIIEDKITVLGKYAFCQAQNLETVRIPNSDNFQILNGAFEKCPNLRAIYVNGREPVEGTLDLSNLTKVFSWSFTEDCLIANVILGENITEISESAFDSNHNLANIYGVPGSAAEDYAKKMGLAFYDVSSNKPQPVKCEIPTDSSAEEQTTNSESVTEFESNAITDESAPITTAPAISFIEKNEQNNEEGMIIAVVIAIAAIAVTILAVVVVVVKKHSKRKI